MRRQYSQVKARGGNEAEAKKNAATEAAALGLHSDSAGFQKKNFPEICSCRAPMRLLLVADGVKKDDAGFKQGFALKHAGAVAVAAVPP